MYSSLFLFSSFLALSSASDAGPYRGLRSRDTPHFQDPSCVEFTLQVNSKTFVLFSIISTCLNNHLGQPSWGDCSIDNLWSSWNVYYSCHGSLRLYFDVIYNFNTEFNWRRHEDFSSEWPESHSPLCSFPCRTKQKLGLMNFILCI